MSRLCVHPRQETTFLNQQNRPVCLLSALEYLSVFHSDWALKKKIICGLSNRSYAGGPFIDDPSGLQSTSPPLISISTLLVLLGPTQASRLTSRWLRGSVVALWAAPIQCGEPAADFI